MKAAVFHRPGQITLEERDVYDIGDDELLVKPRAPRSAVPTCVSTAGGTSRSARANHGCWVTKLSGTIAKVGKLVSGWRVGQRVSFTPNIGCGHCEMCRQGYNNMCPDYEAFGISLDGSFQTTCACRRSQSVATTSSKCQTTCRSRKPR